MTWVNSTPSVSQTAAPATIGGTAAATVPRIPPSSASGRKTGSGGAAPTPTAAIPVGRRSKRSTHSGSTATNAAASTTATKVVVSPGGLDNHLVQPGSGSSHSDPSNEDSP